VVHKVQTLGKELEREGCNGREKRESAGRQARIGEKNPLKGEFWGGGGFMARILGEKGCGFTGIGSWAPGFGRGNTLH